MSSTDARCTVGLFSIGLAAYWPQFPGLRERLTGRAPPAAAPVKSMLVRLFDFLKTKQITCLVTSLTDSRGLEETEVGISSLIDTWFQVRDIEIAGERTRGLYLVICTVNVHFADGMIGWVRVIP